jgi:hypothetical protein
MNKTYLVRFVTNRDGFSGWNTTSAKTLTEAKRNLRAKLGEATFAQIDWSRVVIGKAAEAEDAKLERQFGSLFS